MNLSYPGESCATSTVDIPAERRHFHELDLAGRERAIRDLAAAGASDYAIATATGLSVEAVRSILQARSQGCAA